MTIDRFLIPVLLCLCSPVIASNMGAIAYDLDTDAYGVAWDHPDQTSADGTALNECGKNGRNCVVVTRFVDQCGAFAVGPQQIWGSGYGNTRGIAESAALFYCRQQGNGCSVRVWGCDSTPGYADNVIDDPSTPIDRDANRRRAEESRGWGGEEQYERICRESGGC